MTEEVLQALAATAEPMPGGFSGETFRVGAAGEQAVLRLYLRSPHRAAIDAALLDLVRALVPVPRVLDLRTPEMQTGDGHAYLLTELLPGRRLEEVLPTAEPRLRQTIATNLADVLARLSGIPFRRPGAFVDAGLSVGPRPAPADSLLDWVRAHQADGPLAAWPAADQEGLRAVADRADELLEDCTRWCLVHSDFNAKNLLVDPETGAVTGVLDWEFSHAGTPYTDVGNLLRHQRDEGFQDAVLTRLLERAPAMPANPGTLLELARAADLWALVELASRAGQHQPADAAHHLLRAVARERDLHA